ncbi:MAG: uroporphyrinogen decarboxylase family protein [Planctomycetota bacterium]
MTHRECAMRILHYKPADYVPVVHFGFLRETLDKWAAEGHITPETARAYADGTPVDAALMKKLGFDINWHVLFSPLGPLHPPFQSRVVEQLPDGSRKILTGEGVVVLDVPGAGSIRPDVDHILKDRAAWEEHYLPKLRFSEDRIRKAKVRVGDAMATFDNGGAEFLRSGDRDYPLGLFCGSLYGTIRTWLTLEGSCYLLVDDEKLLDEIIETNANLMYECTKAALETGVKFDFAHFWEDICFKNGPLISPKVFDAKVGPHYKRITDLLRRHGIDVVSLDCDGCIDALIPTWINNGVNTMFPIEVGTWGADIAPWRQRYGKELRGVGGMDKRVFAKDRSAVDVEIERLRRLVDLGGYIPCPDHRIADDAKWDNVRYYCDRMHQVFAA